MKVYRISAITLKVKSLTPAMNYFWLLFGLVQNFVLGAMVMLSVIIVTGFSYIAISMSTISFDIVA